MSIRVVPAYIEGRKSLVHLKFNKPLKDIDTSQLIYDVDKLKKRLNKIKVKYPETIGLLMTKQVEVRILKDGKYNGNIWGTPIQLKGTYEEI